MILAATFGVALLAVSVQAGEDAKAAAEAAAKKAADYLKSQANEDGTFGKSEARVVPGIVGLALHAPEHPFVSVLGGAKVSDKIQVIESLLPRVDALLVGGGMAYTFFRAEGKPTGKSLVEEEKVELARGLLARAGGKLRLPVDHVVAAAFKEDAERKVLPADQIPEGWMGLDIGPQSAASYAAEVRAARLVIWNGPMGVFEMKPFAEGTLAVARAMGVGRKLCTWSGLKPCFLSHKARFSMSRSVVPGWAAMK